MFMKNQKNPSSDTVNTGYLRKKSSKKQELHDSGSSLFYAANPAFDKTKGINGNASEKLSSDEIKAHLDYLKKEIVEMTFALKFFDAFLEKKLK